MNTRILAVTGLALSCAFTHTVNAQYTLRTVATTNGPEGYVSFEYAIIAGDGRVAFVGTNPTRGVYRDPENLSGPPVRLLNTGEAISGECGSVSIANFALPAMNADGAVSLVARSGGMDDCAPCNNGSPTFWEGHIRWDRNGTRHIFVQPGTLIEPPDPNNTTYPQFTSVENGFTSRISGNGQITVYSHVTPCGNGPVFGVNDPTFAQMIAGDSGLQLKAVAGISPIPLEVGTMSNASINASSKLTFYGKLDSDTDGVSGINDPNGQDFGMFWDETAPANIIAREGDPAPGAANPSAVFSELDFHPVINDAQSVAFYARTGVIAAGAYTEQSGGIWISTDTNGDGIPDDLRAVAVHGLNAPGLPKKAVFAGVGDPVLNHENQIAFVAYLESPPGSHTATIDEFNDFAIYRAIPDGLGGYAFDLIAWEGEPAPSVNGSFFDTSNPSPFQDPFINSSGAIAFRAVFDSAPGSPYSVSGNGIWINSSGPSTNTTVVDSTFFGSFKLGLGMASSNQSGSMGAASGGEDGRGTVLNDNGDIVYIKTTFGIPSSTHEVIVASSTIAPLMADPNGDGVSSFDDVGLLLNNFGTAERNSDLNGDGIVDVLDLQRLLQRIGAM